VRKTHILRWVAVGSWLLGQFFLTGCRLLDGNSAAGSSDDSAAMQTLVEHKLEAQQKTADGRQRWDDYKSDEYQTEADIAQDRRALPTERSRQEVAAQRLAAGPLTLEECLVCSLEFNDPIQARRAEIRATSGDALIARSRFLPQMTYYLEHENSALGGQPATNETRQTLRVTQTLLEFGKDHATDVALRESERKALFAYEESVREVLSRTRRKFFTVALRQLQLDERRKSLAEFRERYNQVVALEKARRVLEVDVLTARLNMLNEEANINSLEKEALRQEFNLLNAIGFPVGATNLAIAGAVERFDLSLEAAVTTALKRSSAIAVKRAAVAEQARVARQSVWDYGPKVALQAGWGNNQAAAGVAISNSSGTYGVTAFAEGYAEKAADRYLAELEQLADDEEGWSVNLSVEIPLFDGLERKGLYRRERSTLVRLRHELQAAIDDVELGVRAAYQTMLERRKEVDILRETVMISKERLRVQERLKELGKISDNELETFRNRYFQDQDKYFTQQIALVEAQEDIRSQMRFFEPLPAGAMP
jgi:outer membrane protein TolC